MTFDEYYAAARARKPEIEHLTQYVHSTAVGYAHHMYRVDSNDETKALSKQDLLWLCDGFNAPFGGEVTKGMGSITVKVYTD